MLYTCDEWEDKTLIRKKSPIGLKDPMRTERKKILFQYTLVLIGACLVGILIPFLFKLNYLELIDERLDQHFNGMFFECYSWFQVIEMIVRYSFIHVGCLLLIYLFSFSMINYPISSLVLGFEGLRSSFSLCVLFLFGDTGILISLLFLVSKILWLCLLLAASYRMAVYSLDLKRVSQLGRPMFSWKTVACLTRCVICFIGSIMIIHFIYCGLIYFIT